MDRVPIILGNWKMYKTHLEATAFIKELIPLIKSLDRHVFLAPPFTSIGSLIQARNNSSIIIGAQNMHDAQEGAFTGEISAQMLQTLGAQFVLLGHSERRTVFLETDQFINRKVKRALQHKIRPVLCIGESLEERERDLTDFILNRQIEEGLQGVNENGIGSVILAYEPIWAIGTGLTPTPDNVAEVHRKCRLWIEQRWGKLIAQKISILYGGSVKPNNIHSLMHHADIDGVLVGGAALDPKIFAQIINF